MQANECGSECPASVLTRAAWWCDRPMGRMAQVFRRFCAHAEALTQRPARQGS